MQEVAEIRQGQFETKYGSSSPSLKAPPPSWANLQSVTKYGPSANSSRPVKQQNATEYGSFAKTVDQGDSQSVSEYGSSASRIKIRHHYAEKVTPTPEEGRFRNCL